MPKISVVIPVYNKERYIAQTLNSVLNQVFTDFELIIVDDGSTDNSVNIIKSFSDERIRFFSQRNSGVSQARNFGAGQAQSDLLAFLDADDIWYENHLQEIMELYNRFPEAAFFGTAYQIKYNDKLIKDFKLNLPGDYHLLKRFYRYDKGQALFFTSNFAVKKGIFEFEGGFNTEVHSEDTELFLKLGIHYALGYSNKITMLHINEADNSLFAHYQTEKKAAILKSFEDQEKKDAALKAFLDLNRYVWALEFLQTGQKDKAVELIKQIDKQNLNLKQKLLLKSPSFLITALKKIQRFMRNRGVHLTAFSR